ncbi:SDR family NAD(P)-dependent oxidoreductase [Serratia nematodiphila]
MSTAVEATLRGLIAEHLKMPEHELDDETPLSEFGFDSITMTSFSHLLNQRYGLNLNATVLYEAPTIAALAGYLQQEQPAFVASLAAKAPQPAVQQASLAASASPTPQASLPEPPRPVTAATGSPAVSPAVEATLRGLIAEHLKMPEHELDDETPLSEFGFDSITMTSFSHLLNQRYGLNLNATVLYEAPTIAALAGYLRQAQPGLMASLAATSGLQPPETESVASGVPSPAVSKEGDTHIRPTSAHASYPNNEPIAIIGMSGCFPLSNDIDALWENLLAGRDCIRELPPERWGGNPSPALKHAGVIDGLEFFDPLFFGISPREAKSLDPYQRLLMQTVYNVIEEAGYSVGSLSGSNTALLVATYSSGYRQLQALAGEPVESYSITSIVSSMGPNRMSHWLNWHGPSEPIETACSSSLVGIHRAVQLLRNGECDQAVVGGVNALVTMDMHESLTLAGFLSPTGKCRAFSANVDGYVRSEGAGMLFLKPLAAAERDGDHIYGLIKGSGVNHGGRSSSLTTPNAKAQTDLIERTLRHSGITPDTISYIEAHATGTPVGDPIECKALKDAFTALDDGKINLSHRCGLGSIKSNIGHLEVAAGVAGVIKVLLQLRHRKLVPSINSQPCNPKIDFANSPFYVVTETQDWIAPKDQDGRNLPLRACVNSFGFGGVNAHVILEEYVSEQDNKSLPECAEPVVLVLSARNEERLRLRAQQLCQVMREGAVDLRALAYTLQVGRDAMKARLAIVVNSQDEAIQKLLSFVSNGRDENNGYYNLLKSLSTHAEKDRVIPAYPSDIPALSRLAQSWIQGEMIDWVVLYPGKKPRRLSLPTYPFAKVSHWIPEQITNAPAVSPSQPAKLQPGETCSQDYSYAVQVTGSESWLGLLRRQDIPQMPCSVQLEWVRSAVCVLMEKETSVTLEQVLWLAPLKATAPQNIRIYLKPEGEGRFRYEIRTENTKDEQTIHGRGLVYQNNPAALAPQSLSITTLRSSNALSVVHGDEYYRRLQQAGIVYSQQAQVTTSYEIGEHCLLGRLSKPKNNDLEGLLARLENGLMLAGLLEKGQEDKALLALSSASFWQPLPDEDIVVWCRPARESNKIMPGWDIQIADDIGNVLIEFRGVTFQPSEPSGDEHPPRQKQNAVLPHSDNATELLSAVPHWRTFSANSLDSPWPDSGPSVLWLSHEFEHDDENRLCQRFHLSQELDHLIWEVSPGNVKNAIYGFRLLKSLLAAGWGSKSLKITLITRQAQALGKHESSDPHQATLFGLMGSASKEYPHWHIRLLDIPLRQSLWFTEWQNIPPDPRGWPQLWRHGKWYQRCLLPCKLASTGTATGFRQNGVVVILGGAGGVGKAFSEYLIRRANTQVIWLGRRAEDATISQYRHDLGRLGPAPLYLQADATDKQQLEHAYAEIISRYGTINGIVHSAIVLADRSLALMDEDTFDTALTAKTLTTINLEAVFGQPTLDFFIFFSSIQSFAIWPGQSNYSAGCYFTDAFAHELRSRPYATKVINWGYWGSVGIVATEKYRASMAKQGISSVEYEEAMPELERFSVSPIGQMACAKLSVTLQHSGFAVTSQEYVHITPATQAVSLPHLAKISCPKSIVAHLHAVEDELAYQLWSTLSQLAWMSTPTSVPAGYRAWLNESLRLLRLSGVLFEDTAPSVQTQWQRWQGICQRPEINTVLNPQLTLLTSTLRRLPEILLGQVPATEVIFPNGGFELVEPIYNGNVIVDAFNAQLGEQVEHYIHARLKQDPDATFKILEVGAGTGGASKEVFARLAPYNNNIEEYCFTDLSTAFLLNAQSKYTHSVSGLRTKRLNIEMNPVNQHFDIGGYDIVIASNVVHATRNIQQTLNNIKILLKQNGLLLLNELAKTSLFAHLTFGLLDGWWLSEDKQTRTIGGPGLSSTQWKAHLIQSGFNNVVTSDNDEQVLGFQVISANSDGVVVLDSK